jgi:hypothetical protein
MAERIRLLIHILRRPGGRGVTSDELQDVAGDYARQLLPVKEIEMKKNILSNIFKVRKLEEQYEREEIGLSFQKLKTNNRTKLIHTQIRAPVYTLTTMTQFLLRLEVMRRPAK